MSPRYSNAAAGSKVGLPAREVVAREQPSLGRAEAIDLLRDEALVEREARALDLLLARAAAALVDDAAVGRGECRVPEQCADLGRGQVQVPRAGPGGEQLLGPVDRQSDPANEREAVLRVPDCELENILEPPGSELAKKEKPRAERAGDAGGEHAGPGNELVPELLKSLDRRRSRCDALAA